MHSIAKAFDSQLFDSVLRPDFGTVDKALLVIPNKNETTAQCSHGFLMANCALISHYE